MNATGKIYASQPQDQLWSVSKISGYEELMKVNDYGALVMPIITSVSIVCHPFVDAQTKENIKAPRHWPTWGESICDAEKVSIRWRYHGLRSIGKIDLYQTPIKPKSANRVYNSRNIL